MSELIVILDRLAGKVICRGVIGNACAPINKLLDFVFLLQQV